MTFKKTAGNFVFNIAKKAFKSKDSTPEVIDKVSISKNLKEFQKHKDDIIKSTDKYTKSAKTEEDKIKFRKPVGPALGKLSEITKKKPVEKAKGGRIGLKSGTNPFARKSSLQKIRETFGPKEVKKKEKPKARMMAKKGTPDPKKKKKFPDLTGDGQVTFADVLKGRGVINGKKKPKKKVI